MSADNGVYILRTIRTWKKENGTYIHIPQEYVYRVSVVNAIDNFDWYKNNEPYNIGYYMWQIWGSSEVFTDFGKAVQFAHSLERSGMPTEYGVNQIDTDLVFPTDSFL